MKRNLCFELCLDESGDFVEDISNKWLNPSLVGGLLFEHGSIDEIEARKIIGKDYVHFNQEDNIFCIDVLKKIANYKAEFVIFENKERLSIIDSDTTYLNILSEGIIQLLLFLSAKYGDFELNILIATRKDTVKGIGILNEEEYVKRLKEKIILSIARNALTKKNKWSFNIKFDDARKNKLLMLADCICNTYLTSTSKKFTDTHREIIGKLFNNEYKFSLFSNSTNVQLKRAIAEGRFGDVIFELFFNNDLVKNKNENLNIALDRLQTLNNLAIRNQLMSISFKIDTYIKVNLDYSYLKPILIRLQDELIPLLKDRDIAIPEFNLDIILYLYTVYTHEGSLLAFKQDDYFMAELENITDLFDKMKYYIMYKTRQAINQKNMLDIMSCTTNISKVINTLEQMKDILPIIDGAEERMFGKKNIMLAKAYGTRLQSWTMCIYNELDNIHKARRDYELALMNFTNENDKVRQHIYLCRAECEIGNIKEAIKFMLLSEKIEDNQDESLEKYLTKINEQRFSNVIFKYLIYIQIMSYAKRFGQSRIADKMFFLITKCKLSLETFKTSYSGTHPLEMIYWYMGDYLSYKGEIKQACRYYDMAAELCDLSSKEVTIKVIKLGVLSSKALAYLQKNKTNEARVVVEKLNQEYSRLIMKEIPVSVLKYINVLHDVSKENIDRKTLEEFTLKARAIN